MKRWAGGLILAFVLTVATALAAVLAGAEGIALWAPLALAATFLMPLLLMAALQRPAAPVAALSDELTHAGGHPAAVERRCCQDVFER